MVHTNVWHVSSVKTLSVKVESFYKIIESAQAFPTTEGLEADGVDLGDMTSLVNF